MGKLKKVEGPNVDWRTTPFNMGAAHAAGRDPPHGRYVKKGIDCLRLRIVSS
jgi:hypothetical protein